jgi:hypothetical protein
VPVRFWRARRHELYDLAFDVGLAHGVELTPLVIEHAQFRELQRREHRLAREIAGEGIPVGRRRTGDGTRRTTSRVPRPVSMKAEPGPVRTCRSAASRAYYAVLHAARAKRAG